MPHQQVIHNNCLEYMQSMQDNSIDLIITSPPYNINLKYNSYQDNLNQTDYLNWINEITTNIYRILKSKGSFFLNTGSTSKNPDISNNIRNSVNNNFKLQNHIIWVKSISFPINNEIQSFGHFKPINSKRYLNHQFEDIYHFTKDGDVELDRLSIGVPYQDKSNIERWKDKTDKRCGGDVWFIPYKTTKKKKQHPAGFPVELPEKCIKLHGIKPDMIVLDPFLGAGTTLLACKNLNINGIGIEIDEEYVKIARNVLV